ncbi:MAG: hypothetical protein ABIW76_12615 [Fibrobacteria bacterium]
MKVTLETFLKQSGNTAQTNDKIFAYKYLGVAYAAEPISYPIAESYFFQLFELAPNAYISDLYVSSAVKSLFEKTKERFIRENLEIKEYDEFGNLRVHATPGNGPANNPPKKDTLIKPDARKHPDPASNPGKSPARNTKIRVWPWVLGISTIAAVGGFWWYSNQKKSSKENVIPVNP